MAEETFGLDDELPSWADEEHGVPDETEAGVDDDAPELDLPFSDAPLLDDFPPFDPGLGLAADDPFGAGEPASGGGGAGGAGGPATLRLLDRGVAKWYSQRPKPFTNCMFAALCTPLSYMGFDVPQSFISDLRVASEVPRNKATTTNQSKRAVRKLLPGIPLFFGGMDDDELRERLTSGEIVARVMVRNQLLPDDLRKFTGNFKGGHAIALRKADDPQGDTKVHWLDPMGKPRQTYDGRDVLYSRFENALMRTPTGGVQVAWARRNAALEKDEGEGPDLGGPGMTSHFGGTPSPVDPDVATIVTRGKQNEFVRISKGTPFLNPKTLARAAKAGETADFRVAGRTIDGKFFGVWINTGQVKGASGSTLLLVARDQVEGEPFLD